MSIINAFMTGLFDVLYWPFVGGPGWLSLIVFSALASLFGLLIYKYTSNQTAIRGIKDSIKADLLAIKLYRDDLKVMFRSFGGVLSGSVRLLRYSLVPLAVMIVPFVLAMAQLAERYQWRPFRIGEIAVISARFAPDVDLMKAGVSLEVNGHAVVETPPVRIPSTYEALWRVRAAQNGIETVAIRVNGDSTTKRLTIGEGFDRVTPFRSASGFWDRMLYPSEPPMNGDGPVRAISIRYPDRDSWFCGATYWMLWLMGLSFAFAFLLKPLIGVEF